jgi:transposase
MKDRGIIIIGSGDIGKTILYNMPLDFGIESIKVSVSDMVEICGKKYELIPTEKKYSKYNLPIEIDSLYHKKVRTISSDVNIVNEFKKIQNKESELSSWERAEVIRLFNKKYRVIP